MNYLGEAFGKFLSRRNTTSTDLNYATMTTTQNIQKKVTGLSNIHSDGVVSLVEAEPGYFLSGSIDKTAVLFDCKENKLIERWYGHSRDITKVAYGRKSCLSFTASRDKTIMIWKRGQSTPIHTFSGHDLAVTGIAVCPNNNSIICSGSRDNSLRLWDIEKRSCLANRSISRNLVTHLSWSPTSDLIAQTSEDKELRLWDPDSLSLIHSFPKKQHIQLSCDVSSDGKYCVTCSGGVGRNGCEATLWDLRERKLLHEFHGHEEAVLACKFLSNTSIPLVVTAGIDGSIRFWDQNSSDCIAIQHMEGMGHLTALAAPELDLLLVATLKRGIQQLHLRQIFLENVEITSKGFLDPGAIKPVLPQNPSTF